MRTIGNTHFRQLLGAFGRLGVETVWVDEADFAGVLQRLHAAPGGIELGHMRRLLDAGMVHLGGYGWLRRFDYVPASERPRPEEDASSSGYTWADLAAEFERYRAGG